MVDRFSYELSKKIIVKFLDPQAPVNWGAEIKIGKRLVRQYPNENFWDWLVLKFKPMSLAYFLSPYGKIFLVEQLEIYKKLQIPKTTLSDTKQGKDKVFVPTINTLKDFLKK